MATTRANGLVTPEDLSENDVPLFLKSLADQLDTRLIPRYTTVAARNAAIPTPVENQFCIVAGTYMGYSGNQWVKYGGPPTALYENPDAGGSGTIQTNAAVVYSPVLTVNVPASGIASYTSSVDAEVGVKSSTGGSVGRMRISVAGTVVRTKGFNAVTAGVPVPVHLTVPCMIPAATWQLVVSVAITAGVAASVDYSSMYVDF